ncbi:MAG: hypothetical protein E6J26_10365 [Chloroflexi bacterium]|nr:MAG: hypothetical protein E6J26_10365 [Chloroflexota bacterium]
MLVFGKIIKGQFAFDGLAQGLGSAKQAHGSLVLAGDARDLSNAFQVARDGQFLAGLVAQRQRLPI